MATDRDRERERWRAWYHRTRETRLAYQRDWYARNKEQQRQYRKQHGDHHHGYRDRKAYMRAWHAKLKAQAPERYAAYLRRSNKARAVRGLPKEIHDMRVALFDYRSKLHLEGRA